MIIELSNSIFLKQFLSGDIVVRAWLINVSFSAAFYFPVIGTSPSLGNDKRLLDHLPLSKLYRRSVIQNNMLGKSNVFVYEFLDYRL